MGMSIIGRSRSKFDGNPSPNPNPAKFEIIEATVVGNYTVVLINYPDSPNYEGNKILVFENMSLKRLRSLKEIDPHFSERGLSPIARFEPTTRGRYMAVAFTQELAKWTK